MTELRLLLPIAGWWALCLWAFWLADAPLGIMGMLGWVAGGLFVWGMGEKRQA